LPKRKYAYHVADTEFESRNLDPRSSIGRELRQKRDREKDDFIKAQQKLKDLEFQLHGHSMLRSEGYSAGTNVDDTLVIHFNG